MQKDLENLWFDYVIESPTKYSKKEKDAIDKLSEKEAQLHSALNNEQIQFFTEYDNAISEVNSISEKNAFIKGIMFTTKFIFQALCEK